MTDDEIAKPEDDSAHGDPVTVFVSDPSAEAERLAQSLRAEGYVVVDVPLSMLVARVAVQKPKVILVDADAEGAIEAAIKVREVDEADEIDVIFLGKAGEALAGMEDALASEGSGFFARPVDVASLLKKLEALTGGTARPPKPISVPPPSRPSSRAPASGAGPGAATVPPSLPPPSMRAPEIRPSARNTPAPRPSIPQLASSPMELSPPSLRKSTSVQAPLSNELEALLVEAEQRIGGQFASESMLPSPEEEIEAVLPAEVLASLDEPLEDDEDDAIPDAGLGALHRGNTTGAGKITTGGHTGAEQSTGDGTPLPVQVTPPRATSSAPSMAPKTHGGTHSGSTTGSTGGTMATGAGGTVARIGGFSEIHGRDVSPPPPEVEIVERRESDAPAALSMPALPLDMRELGELGARSPNQPAIPGVLGPTDAPRALALAIAGRGTGVLAFESRAGVRRVVLREGDVVTAASTVEDESLLPFLAARGELPRDRVAQLAGKVPASGRHAGAALVAHGYMRQDQLWSVLRAHAEWIIARIVAQTSGTARFENDPQTSGRLRSEPSVFGGSTGAEVFVENVRRVIAPAEAIERLGGETSRIAEGAAASLTSECALGAAETQWLARARGKTIGEAIASAGDPDFAAVLYALVLLGVCDAIRALGAPRVNGGQPPPPAVDALDEEAVRARVRARMQLVDEGDYFAVLGVQRDATSYEVKRAFLELRRAFEPSRLLTPSLADMVDDVRKIANVLDEAYEILRDGARRERYRRAIDASPR